MHGCVEFYCFNFFIEMITNLFPVGCTKEGSTSCIKKQGSVSVKFCW